MTVTIDATFGTLTANTDAITCTNTLELLKAGGMRGGGFVVPGVDGEVWSDGELGPVYLEPRFRINGKTVHGTGASTGSTVAAWRGGMWTSWQIVHDVGTVKTGQTFTLADTGAGVTWSAEMYVTEPPEVVDVPVPWILEVQMGIVLPSGTMF